MQLYNYKSTSLNFIIPDDWQIEEENNFLSIYDPINGVGALQFSVFWPPDAALVTLESELIEFITDSYKKAFFATVQDDRAYTDYLVHENGAYWKYWLIRKDDMIIFGTYNCSKENAGKEDKIVDEIINLI
jgi:hypothetical protein